MDLMFFRNNDIRIIFFLFLIKLFETNYGKHYILLDSEIQVPTLRICYRKMQYAVQNRMT